MAEQSMFWPTTGTGDGVAGGYSDTRLRDIWKAMLGNGLIKYLNDLAASGTGSSNLVVATGAAMVGGYLYENNSSATIVTSTLSTGGYGLYIIANESASALTVSRSVAGTTVGAKTVRLALNGATPTQPYVKLASVGISAGVITSIAVESDRWSTQRGITSSSNLAILIMGALGETVSVPNNTETTIVSTFGSDSDYVSVDPGTGTFTVRQEGTYAIFAQVDWDTNTTNRRRLTVDGFTTQFTAASFITTSVQTLQSHVINAKLAGETITVEVWQDSGGTRIVDYAYIYVARL